MEIRFSRAIPQEVAARCVSIKTDYNYRKDRVVTLGFIHDPTDCHGEDLANLFIQAIRHSRARGNVYGMYVETVMPLAEDGTSRPVAVSSLNEFVGHQVVHEQGKESRVYLTMKYVPVRIKPEH